MNTFDCRSQDECNFKYESTAKDDYEYYLPEKLKNIQFCAGNFDTDVREIYEQDVEINLINCFI